MAIFRQRHKGASELASKSLSTASHLWVSLALFAASIDPIIVKMGYMSHCTPWQLLCLKSVVGAVILWLITRQTTWVGSWSFWKGVLPVSLLLLCTNTLMLCSLQYIEASMLITVLTVTPAAVAVVNQTLGRDVLGVKFWIGFALCAAGLILTTGGGFGSLHSWGIVLALAAVVSSTVYRVLLEKQTSIHNPSLVSTYIFVINGICMLPTLFFFMLQSMSFTALLSGSVLGITASMANLAFLWAISQLGSTRVSIIAMLQRPLVIVVAAIALKETLTMGQIVGSALIVIGICLARVQRKVAAQNTGAEQTIDQCGTNSRLAGAPNQSTGGPLCCDRVDSN